jgi:hydrogenase/urease accessory protein HupE
MSRAVALLALFAALFVASGASAHAVGLSKGEYVLQGTLLRADAVFARGELTAAVPALDPDRDGLVTADDVARSRPALEKLVQGGVLVRGDGRACPATLEGARLTEEDGLALAVTFTCPSTPVRVEVELKLLEELSHGHRHVAHLVSGPITIDEVTYRGHETVEALAQAPATEAPKRTIGALGFLWMGIEHILTGYDHLVFLLGLVLVGGRLRSLVAVVTAFTVAHSLTLAIAVLGAWAPPSRVVEPLIALSIAYVGVENFFVKSAENRWRITFPFGLVHGFGFAGALREIALPRGEVPGALVCFNLGVEAGQLAVLAVALPLVLYLRKRAWFSMRGIGALSGAVALAGVFWFLERVVRGG